MPTENAAKPPQPMAVAVKPAVSERKPRVSREVHSASDKERVVVCTP